MTFTIPIEVLLITIAILSFTIPFGFVLYFTWGMSAFGGWDRENWFMLGMGTIGSLLMSALITIFSYGLIMALIAIFGA